RCACRGGCPACVGSWTRDRRLVAWGLQRLAVAKELDIPASVVGAARVPWDEVASRAADVAAALRAQRFAGAALSTGGGSVGLGRGGAPPVLPAPGPALAAWPAGAGVLPPLRAALAAAVAVPADFRLTVEVAEQTSDPLRRAIQLQRRHDDL